MSGEILALLMFLTACAFLMSGYPVALTLAGTALLFAFIGDAMGVFLWPLLNAEPLRIWKIMQSAPLVAIPLFVFMGVMLERSQVASELLETMGKLFGSLRGGLGLSVVFVGTLMAAATGIVGATVVTMGLLSLPTMLRVGYSPRLAAGTICAAGTLGQIIPPSIVLILLGDVLGGVIQDAAMIKGDLAPEPVSAMDLFAGALLPGLLLVLLYAGWQVVMAVTRPEACPPMQDDTPRREIWRRAMVVVVVPLGLILLVLGSILSGLATPTESAAVGAVGAAVFAAIMGRLDRRTLGEVARATTQIIAMVFLILIGAALFSIVFRGLGGDEFIVELLSDLPGGKWTALAVVMAVVFALGFFLDFIEIISVVVPIVGPVLIALGFDPLWLGVMIGLNLQTSFLTPPFGFALFYLRGVAPPQLRTTDIYRGVLPFIAIQVLALVILTLMPELATWLPRVLF